MSQGEGEAEAPPELVDEFPAPPKVFALYKDGVESGPAPPEPMVPTYHLFGTPYSTEDAVPDLLPDESKKLYKPSGDELVDYKAELKKLNHSLLASFVQLVDVLMHKPAAFNSKLDDIELLFLNMHNLINSFRPHQARETIIQMLQDEVQARQDATHDIRQTIEDARKAVEESHTNLSHTSEDIAEDVEMEAPAQPSSPTKEPSEPREEDESHELQELQTSFFQSLQNVLT